MRFVCFDANLVDALGTLNRQPPVPSWNDALPFIRVLLPDLRRAGPGDTLDAGEQRRLSERLAKLLEALAAERESVADYNSMFLNGLDNLTVVMDRLQILASSEDYVELYRNALDVYEGPGDLAADLERWDKIAGFKDIAVAAIGMRTYLDSMRFGHRNADLDLDATILTSMIDPGSLLDSHGLWGSVRQRFEGLRLRYRERYLAHHKAYHDQAVEYHNRLDAVMPQIEYLAVLQTIDALGEPRGLDLTERYKSELSSLKLCGVREESLTLDDSPVCPSCLLALDEELPLRSVPSFLGDLERAMRHYNSSIGRFVARQTVTRASVDQLDRFIDLVSVADPSKLANVLDDKVIEFLRTFLKE
jgi:hypothetical protein